MRGSVVTKDTRPTAGVEGETHTLAVTLGSERYVSTIGCFNYTSSLTTAVHSAASRMGIVEY